LASPRAYPNGFLVGRGLARPGMAWRGWAGLGVARHGSDRGTKVPRAYPTGFETRLGKAWRGPAWRGMARRGEAWHGAARRGERALRGYLSAPVLSGGLCA